MIYSRPIRTLSETKGRYPTEDEVNECLGWADSLPERLRSSNLLASKEADIVREAIEEMKPKYPRFGAQHDRAYEKGARDLSSLIRYAVQAMVVDDVEMPKEKLYVWYGTIIRSLGLTPAFAKDSCQAVYDAARRQLAPDAFNIAEPYLARMIEDVSAYPEPMKPSVN
ncbi:MAG: hypothetical protein U0798_12760 [Gemmataceae bacterium]